LSDSNHRRALLRSRNRAVDRALSALGRFRVTARVLTSVSVSCRAIEGYK
jgi:hypothetical protein